MILPTITDVAEFARTTLPLLLDELLDNEAALTEIAGRSYRHDNGFVKIVLAERTAGGSSLRLHAWKESQADGRGNIHNHCWDFDSYVIAGALSYEEYELDPRGAVDAIHYGYDPSSSLDYALKPVGPVHLRITGKGNHPAGSAYAMTAEVLHRTWSDPAEYTATLLQQGARRRAQAAVYATEAIQPEHQNLPLNSDELTRELVRIRPYVG